MPPHLTLNASDRAIGDLRIGRSVQRDAGRKPTGVAAHDLDAADGLASWPLLYSIKALFS